MWEAVKFEVHDHVAYITLNRQEKMNAINQSMRRELQQAYTEVKFNPDIWVVILTGEGKAFCSGKDLLEKIPQEDGTVMSNDELYLYQRHIYKPFIVAINGPCLAQGAGFALMSDIRIMSEEATFGWPQVKRGISSVSGPSLFAHTVPYPVAMKYLMRGIPLTAHEALEHHVVHEVVPREQLMETAKRWASDILQAAPAAVHGIKEAVVRGADLSLEDRIFLSRDVADRVLLTEDSKEGILAFKEKRSPKWLGR